MVSLNTHPAAFSESGTIELASVSSSQNCVILFENNPTQMYSRTYFQKDGKHAGEHACENVS